MNILRINRGPDSPNTQMHIKLSSNGDFAHLPAKLTLRCWLEMASLLHQCASPQVLYFCRFLVCHAGVVHL